MDLQEDPAVTEAYEALFRLHESETCPTTSSPSLLDRFPASETEMFYVDKSE
jgi:hypothetical protein